MRGLYFQSTTKGSNYHRDHKATTGNTQNPDKKRVPFSLLGRRSVHIRPYLRMLAVFINYIIIITLTITSSVQCCRSLPPPHPYTSLCSLARSTLCKYCVVHLSDLVFRRVCFVGFYRTRMINRVRVSVCTCVSV